MNHPPKKSSMNRPAPPRSADKPLFTPGPLTTSQTVKLAMVRDLGSRDGEFVAMVEHVRAELLDLAGVSQSDGYETVLMQGSGTFGVEAVVSSVVPPQGKLLVCINGSYGDRIARMADVHRIPLATVRAPEDQQIDPAAVEQALKADAAITDVAIVHCETTSGILNPIEEVGRIASQHNKTYFVDSMSAFGAVEFDFRACEIDYLVSSANKCIEGVPGFGFVLAGREVLAAAQGRAHSVSLDVHAQWAELERSGQWRYTPPTHAVAAFLQALHEHADEGGVAARGARYAANRNRLVGGMRQQGFETLLADEWLSPVITTFFCPADPAFAFADFYDRMKARGFILYPGKLTVVDSFRVGTIGRFDTTVIDQVLTATAQSLHDMGVASAAPPAAALAERAKFLSEVST